MGPRGLARTLITLLRRAGREQPLDEDAVLAIPDPAGDDPAVAHVRAHRRAALEQAFERAIEELDARDRTLLRLHVVDGLNIDEIGRIYDVHRVTAARWLTRARGRVVSVLRRDLSRTLGLDREALDSFLREARSQLDLSLERVLG